MLNEGSHYGLSVGMWVNECAFGKSLGPAEVIELDPTDKNRVRARLTDGDECVLVAEWCVAVDPKDAEILRLQAKVDDLEAELDMLRHSGGYGI